MDADLPAECEEESGSEDDNTEHFEECEVSSSDEGELTDDGTGVDNGNILWCNE